MLIDICLLWIGMQLKAPIWYYVLVGFVFFCNIISYGLRMFNKGKVSVNKTVTEVDESR